MVSLAYNKKTNSEDDLRLQEIGFIKTIAYRVKWVGEAKADDIYIDVANGLGVNKDIKVDKITSIKKLVYEN